MIFSSIKTIHPELHSLTHHVILHKSYQYHSQEHTQLQPQLSSVLIIQAGIKRVVYGENYRLTDGIDLLKRAGIEVVYLGE